VPNIMMMMIIIIIIIIQVKATELIGTVSQLHKSVKRADSIAQLHKCMLGNTTNVTSNKT